MLKFACAWLSLLMLVTACASGPAEPGEIAQERPTQESDEALPTPTPASPDDGPTPLVIPTIVASGLADADDDDTATATATTTVTPAPQATPRPTSTPRPIPTAVNTSPTPRPAVPTPTAAPPRPTSTPAPPRPTATAVPPAPTPTSGWINPDCYVGPGAADELVWWCGGRICVVGAPHQGCPTTPPPSGGIVEVSCTISKNVIVVDEIITLQAFQDPVNVPITFAFGHGDGTIDEASTSYAYYEAPGTYEVIMYWRQGRSNGSLLCGRVTVGGGGPVPTPTTSPVVQISCTISPSRDVVVGEPLTFTAVQDRADVPITYIFDHGDGTLDPTAISSAYYAAPGYYEVRLRWAHSGTNGTILCGTVTVGVVFSASNYLGKTKAQADAQAASNSLFTRVLRIDNQSFPATTDARPDRVNLEIDNGVVTKAFIG